MDKKFTAKAGYGGLLDFDPANGIVKYGSYEAYLKDMNIKPQSLNVSFDDYLQALQQQQQLPGIGTQSLFMSNNPAQKDKLRQQFMSDMANGKLSYSNDINTIGGSGPRLQIAQDTNTGDLLHFSTPKAPSTGQYREVVNLGGDRYRVDTYAVPNDPKFLNQLADRAAGIQVTQDQSLLQQNRQDAANRRQGAGSTVLSASGAAAAINS